MVPLVEAANEEVNAGGMLLVKEEVYVAGAIVRALPLASLRPWFTAADADAGTVPFESDVDSRSWLAADDEAVDTRWIGM